MKRSESYALRKVSGEALLVPLGRQVRNANGLVALNDTGSYLWEKLAKDCSIEDLATALAKQFNIDIAKASADVQSFISVAKSIGVVEE